MKKAIILLIIASSLMINAQGLVGIGTTNPNASLHLLSSGNNMGLVIENSAVTTGTKNAFRFMQYQDNKLYVQRWNSGASTWQANLLTLQPDGNLGVGTANPNASLHLLSSGNNMGLVVENSAVTTGTKNAFRLMQYQDNKLYFQRWNSGASSWEANLMTLQPNGRLGIGTASPSAKLHVFDSNGGEPMVDIESNDDVSLRLTTNYNSGASSGEAYIEFESSASSSEGWQIGLNDNEQLLLGYRSLGGMGSGQGTIGHEIVINKSDNNHHLIFDDYQTSNGRALLPSSANYGSCGTLANYFDDGYFSEIYRDTEYSISDMRVKENIRLVSSGVEKVQALNPVLYDVIAEKHPYYKDGVKEDEKHQLYDNYGFLAQELNEVVPEMVHYNKELGLYTIRNYEQLLPILVKATQEQQEQLEAVKNELAQEKSNYSELKKEVEELKRLILTSK